jgi:hypothetical protein
MISIAMVCPAIIATILAAGAGFRLVPAKIEKIIATICIIAFHVTVKPLLCNSFITKRRKIKKNQRNSGENPPA